MKGVSLIPSSCPWSINWRRWHICKSASSLATIHVIWGFKVQEIAVWFVRLQFSVQYGLQKPPYQSCPPTVIHSCISLMTFLERAKAFSCLTAGQVREPAQTKKEWAEDREWAEKQLPLLFSWMLLLRWVGKYGGQNCSFSERYQLGLPWQNHEHITLDSENASEK